MSVLKALLLRRKFTLLAVVGALMLVTASTAIQPAQGTTPLTNPGFEAGDLSGWTTGGSNGAATAQTSFTCSGVETDCNGTTVSPVEGTYFALLTAGDPDVYTTASQTFTAAAGAKISGNARFLSSELTAELFVLDNAQVVIKNASTNDVVATVFSADSSTNSTPWEQWQHTFADSGDYYVEAGVRNYHDELLSSYLALDNVVLVNPPPTADTTPPTVEDTSPDGPASKTDSITATFSEEVQNVTSSTFILERKISVKKNAPPKFTLVAATVTPSEDGLSAVLDPVQDLPKGEYRATIKTDVTDMADNALVESEVWTFKVAK